jgi:hypothetical protein
VGYEVEGDHAVAAHGADLEDFVFRQAGGVAVDAERVLNGMALETGLAAAFVHVIEQAGYDNGEAQVGFFQFFKDLGDGFGIGVYGMDDGVVLVTVGDRLPPTARTLPVFMSPENTGLYLLTIL